MTLVRRTIVMLLLIVCIGLLSWAHNRSFAGNSSTEVPHIGYGDSVELSLPAFVWLDVEQGDIFTVRTIGDDPISDDTLQIAPLSIWTEFSWMQLTDSGAKVFYANQPGPYLWTSIGTATTIVTLERGNTVDIDRGQIAIGDTVTGIGTDSQADFYSIDLTPNSALSIHLTGPCSGYLPLFLPELKRSNILNLVETDSISKYLVIPSDVSGTHQILVRCSSHEYSLSVVAGIDMAVDKGLLTFDEPISDINPVGHYDAYQLDIEKGDLVTVWLQIPSPMRLHMEAYDSTGNPLEDTDGFFEEGVYSNFLTETDGPYTLYVWTEQPYTISMTKGLYQPPGFQSVRLGESIVVQFRVLETHPSVPEVWLEDVPDGTWVTLQTKNMDFPSQYIDVELFDVMGRSIFSKYQFHGSDGSAYSAFYLVGPGPYWIYSLTSSTFSLTVMEGEQLLINGGEIKVGQLIEGSSTEYGPPIRYTLADISVEGQVSIRAIDTDIWYVHDAEENRVEPIFSNSATDSENRTVYHQVYQLDDLCPCSLVLLPNDTKYAVEVMSVPTSAFPSAQPLNLGETVSSEHDDSAWVDAYTFEIDSYGEVSIRLEFDPTLTNRDELQLEFGILGESYNNQLHPYPTSTESGEGYIVQQYPLYFPGEYTVWIKNLYGPYTLTVNLE